MTVGCPVTGSDRITDRPGEADAPALERTVDEQGRATWHVRSLALVREVLRRSGEVHQSGFGSEAVRQSMPLTRWPVLWADGDEHRAQRTKVARYFAPTVVDTRYRELIEARADAFLARLDAGEAVDMSELTLHFSAQVAAQVIGLTDSDQEAMARRLVGFFDQPAAVLEPGASGWRRLLSLPAALPGSLELLRFHLKDVRPALKARRAETREDVLSHLIAEGYSELEIVMECVTYAAAGMVTTREFLQVCAWHLLTDEDLRTRFLGADSAGRRRILHELLRLEPVVGHLLRRAVVDVRLMTKEGEVTIPAGDRLDLYVRAANADPAIGDDGKRLCPERTLPRGVRAEVMSFGDGPHRCPGNTIAMIETEVLLERLLRRDVELVGEPRIEWEDLIAGYAVRGLVLRQGVPA